MQDSSKSTHPETRKENMLLNIGFNILLPISILNKGRDWFGEYLELYFDNTAVAVMLIALLFPAAYFIYDYCKRSKYNLFSIIGLFSVLLTGGIGILELPTRWFAFKEAAVPLFLGLAVIVSLKTPWPLIRTLVYNPEIIDVDKVHEALQASGKEPEFEKLLGRCTWLVALSFILSSLLNYTLARKIVVSPSGTDAFNTEVSKMMAWSWPVIVVPSLFIMAGVLWMLIKGIYRMTGLRLESIIAVESKSE